MVWWPVAGLLCFVLAHQAGAGEVTPMPPAGEVRPAAIDGLEFCEQLAARVEKAAQVQAAPGQPGQTAEVAELIREGKAQCAAGHIRNGVHRLRIALMSLGGG